jgi:hypothetical protein
MPSQQKIVSNMRSKRDEQKQKTHERTQWRNQHSRGPFTHRQRHAKLPAAETEKLIEGL